MPFFKDRFLLAKKFSLRALLAAVAVAALMLNFVRPPSKADAERIAARHVRKNGIPIRATARPVFPYYWLVEITELTTGELWCTVSVDRWSVPQVETVGIRFATRQTSSTTPL